MSRETKMTAHPDVVLSSTCFKERSLPSLCEKLTTHNIDKIELSGNLQHLPISQIVDILCKYKNKIKFYIHNYFPAPEIPIVLNLAHPGTVANTIEHCKKAIDLCTFLESGFYSLHAGMSFAPKPLDLGKDQTHLTSMSLTDSWKILEEACLKISEYAKEKNIQLLLENNVVASFNCPEKVNDRYHFSDLNESARLLSLFNQPHVGALLDTGHLKVSATTLDFDPIQFIERFAPYIQVAQISDNDGMSDQNLPVREDSWFWEHIPWQQMSYVSLEVSGQSIEKLLSQLELTETMIAKNS
jgi:sugar phosphate isomerase/epimerase